MAISGRVFIPECRGFAEVPKDEKYILVTKDRFKASKRIRRHEVKSALMKINDPERVEQVANAICLLIRAYEDKDRPSKPR